MFLDPTTIYALLQAGGADDDTLAATLGLAPGVVRAWREKPPPEGRADELRERLEWCRDVGPGPAQPPLASGSWSFRPRLATALIGLPHPLEIRPDPEVEAEGQPPDVTRRLRPMPRRQQFICQLVALELAAAVVLGASLESVAADLLAVLRSMDEFLQCDNPAVLRNPAEPLSWSARLTSLDLIRPDHEPPPSSLLTPLIEYWLEDARNGQTVAHDMVVGPCAELASQRQFGRHRVPPALFLRRWWARCRQRLAFRHASAVLLEPPHGPPASAMDDTRVPNPCPVDLTEMACGEPDDRIRTCPRCGRAVFAVAGLTRPGIDALITRHAGFATGCVFQRLDGGLMLDDCGDPVRVQTRTLHY